MDCSPPGSSVHGISQAKILKWVAISFSRGSSWTTDQTWVSCIAGGFFTSWATREVRQVGKDPMSPSLQKPFPCLQGARRQARDPHFPPTNCLDSASSEGPRRDQMMPLHGSGREGDSAHTAHILQIHQLSDAFLWQAAFWSYKLPPHVTHQYVTSHGIRDSTDAIKVINLLTLS